MLIASYGNVVFATTSFHVQTLSELTRKGSGRWAVQEVIGSNCKAEFLGPGQGELSFKILLLAELGVVPSVSAALLRQMMASGTVAPFIIAGQPVGDGWWYIETQEESERIVNSLGITRRLVLNVVLKEYF